jgi:predicted DNA-binding transcriptional regulator AlpA
MERLLSRREAADLLRVPTSTLAAWAYRKTGPRFYKIGKWTRYSEGELLTWLERRAVETGGGP